MNTKNNSDTEMVLSHWHNAILNSFFTIAAITLAAVSHPKRWFVAISFSGVELFLIAQALLRAQALLEQQNATLEKKIMERIEEFLESSKIQTAWYRNAEVLSASSDKYTDKDEEVQAWQKRHLL